MLSILILSNTGEGYGLATRFAQEGHIVKIWVQDNRELAAQSHLPKLRQVYRYEEHIESADLIIPYGRGFDELGGRLLAAGKVVYGGGVQDFLEDALITATGESYQPTAEGPKEVELGFWNGKWNWLARGRMYHELLDKDRGPRLNLMGAALEAVNSLPNIEEMDLASFTGFVVVESTMTEAPVMTYLSTHPDSGILAAIAELAHTDLGEALYRLCAGEDAGELTGCSVVVSILRLSPLPLPELNAGARKHFWSESLGMLTGMLTAQGSNYREARRRVYRTSEALKLNQYVYRTDVADSGR